MLNKRHKVILFITLVTVGSALLAGAKLSEALGMLLLGIAFAWLIGSETASRAYHALLRLPSKTWPWFRVLFFMALGGCLFVAVGVWSNFNAFLVVAAMSVFGMVISPFHELPTQRRWLKWVVWLLAVVVFFLSAVGMSMLSETAEKNAERVGQLAVYALIALPIGMLWLIKGWKLILSGIRLEPPPESSQAETSNNRKGTAWLYISLFVGTLVLTAWLGLLAFSAFSDSTFAFEVKPTSTPSSPLSPVIFLVLVAWWPYACWKGILGREPNTTVGNVKRHKRVTTILGALFVMVQCVAMVFGIQNGNDRMLTAQVEGDVKNFQDVAAQIGAIKSRDLRTTKDYIDAYQEIDPLLDEFDTKLQRFTDILSVVKDRERSRGPLNIQRLYGSKGKEWMVWDVKTFELLRQDSELTKKQVQVVKQMADIPEDSQVEFWKKNFQPLQQEEDLLRQKLESAKQSMPAK